MFQGSPVFDACRPMKLQGLLAQLLYCLTDGLLTVQHFVNLVMQDTHIVGASSRAEGWQQQ